MYSLFCEILNKVQMKLMKLQSYTDFDISLFDFSCFPDICLQSRHFV